MVDQTKNLSAPADLKSKYSYPGIDIYNDTQAQGLINY
jgi:hypothetical protein